MKRRVLLFVLAGLLGVLGLVIANRAQIRAAVKQLPVVQEALGRKTVEEQIEVYGPAARARLNAVFTERNLKYPPDAIAFVAIKDEKQLQVYVRSGNSYSWLKDYPILGASGDLGPKLRQGDRQVPEGIYRIFSLEPNTPYHLGLRVNYPNEFDLARAQEEGRTDPGGDILIHGNTGSIGCLAMGDEASEDLFVLVHDTIDKQVPLIIAPVDLRKVKTPAGKEGDPIWLSGLYEQIKSKLSEFPQA